MKIAFAPNPAVNTVSGEAAVSWKPLQIAGAVSLLVLLAFVAYSNLYGWRALVTVENMRTVCDEDGACVRKVPLNRFRHELTIPGSTAVADGDLLLVSFKCARKGCRVDTVRIFPTGNAGAAPDRQAVSSR